MLSGDPLQLLSQANSAVRPIILIPGSGMLCCGWQEKQLYLSKARLFSKRGLDSEMKNDKSMTWPNGLLGLVLLVLASLVVGCAPTSVGSSGNVEAAQLGQEASIRVTGFGEALGQPDEAQVTVGVETFSPKVNDATAENEATVAAILDSLEEAGIDAEDIQTSNYNLWAEQRYGENGPEGIAGYHVSNQVMVLIRDVGKVGDLLAAVIAAGANSIYGVQFSVADPAALEAEAREKALEDARQRVESLVQLSGLTLDSILAIEETVGQYPEFARGGGDGLGGGVGGAVQASSSISPGQLSYRSQVQVTFAVSE